MITIGGTVYDLSPLIYYLIYERMVFDISVGVCHFKDSLIKKSKAQDSVIKAVQNSKMYLVATCNDN